MKSIVMLAYAQVPNRLYALCDDGNLYWRNETGRQDQPWVRDGGIPEDPVEPVTQAPELETQPDLPLAPAPETGLTGMLGASESPFKEPPLVPVEAQAAPAQTGIGSPAFIAPGSIPAEAVPVNQAQPILPQK